MNQPYRPISSLIRAAAAFFILGPVIALYLRSSIRFVAPVYGTFFPSEHFSKIAFLQVGLGAFLPRPKRTFAPRTAILGLLLAVGPIVMRALFPFSKDWTYEWGPYINMIPAYVPAFMAGMLVDQLNDVMMVTSALLLAPQLEGFAREYGTTCEIMGVCAVVIATWALVEGLAGLYTPPAPKVKVDAPAPTDTPKKKKNGKDQSKAAVLMTPGKLNPIKAVHLIPFLLTIGLVYSNLNGGIKQCNHGVYELNSPTYKTLARADSVTGYVSVSEDPTQWKGIRVLRCDHSIIGGVFLEYNMDSVFGSFYWLDFVRFIERPVDKNAGQPRALQLGLGIGVTVGTMVKNNVSVDIVELDPAVVKFAQDHFALPPVNDIHVGDGRRFVQKIAKNETYDYVLHDVFTGGLVPGSLFSLEMFKSVRRILKPEGILAVNFVGNVSAPATGLVIRTLKKVFEHIEVYSERHEPHEKGPREPIFNMVFFCSSFPMSLRTITQKDKEPFKDSRMWLHMVDNFYVYNVKPENVTGLGFDTEGPIVTDLDNPLRSMQKESAKIHWRIMRGLFPVEFWEES